MFKKLSNWESSSWSTSNLVFTILDQIHTVFNSNNLFDVSNEQNTSENGTEYTNGSTDSTAVAAGEWPSAKGLYELIKYTATLKSLTEPDMRRLCLKVLILSSVPLIRNEPSFDSRLYERFIRKLLAGNQITCQLSLAEFVEKMSEEFMEVTTGKNRLSQVDLFY